MDNFKVGDTVQVIEASNSLLENGDIGVITLIEWKSAKVKVDGRPHFANWISFKDLKLIPTDSQRIEALEERVEALERLAEDYFKVPVEPSTDIKEDKQ